MITSLLVEALSHQLPSTPFNARCLAAWKHLARTHAKQPVTPTGHQIVDCLIFFPEEKVISLREVFDRMMNLMIYAFVLCLPKRPADVMRVILDNAYGTKNDFFTKIDSSTSFLPSCNGKPSLMRIFMMIAVLMTSALLTLGESDDTFYQSHVAKSLYVDTSIRDTTVMPLSWLRDVGPWELADAQANIIMQTETFITQLQDTPVTVEDIDRIMKFKNHNTDVKSGSFHTVYFHDSYPDVVLKTYPSSERRNLLIMLILSKTRTSCGILGTPIQKMVYYDDHFYIFAQRMDPLGTIDRGIRMQQWERFIQGLDELRGKYGLLWTYENDMHMNNVMYDRHTDTLRVIDTDYFWFFDKPEYNSPNIPGGIEHFSLTTQESIVATPWYALARERSQTPNMLNERISTLEEKGTTLTLDNYYYKDIQISISASWAQTRFLKTALEQQDLGLLPEVLGIQRNKDFLRVYFRFPVVEDVHIASFVSSKIGIPIEWNEKHGIYKIRHDVVVQHANYHWQKISRNMVRSLQRRYMNIESDDDDDDYRYF